MRIAVVSTIYKTTPPVGYGGIERIVYTLVEQFIRDGHDVVLFAAPGSHCSGKTIEVEGCDNSKAPCGIIKKSDMISEEPLYEAMRSYLHDHPVDVIHDWSFQNLFVLRYPEAFPFIISTCFPPLSDYKRPNLVACSNAHALLCGGSTKYVYYGLNLNDYKFSYSKKDYFIHIAKIAKYKGQHLAVMAFRKTKKKLEIAGNIEDSLYYQIILKPLLWFSPNVSYLGEIQGTNNYLFGARALIQTPRWFDAFPLVILEAFASGTPVISFSEGGIPEQIVNGLNGYLCKNTDDIISAVNNISQIKPQDCRYYAEEYFSVIRMSEEYLGLYNRVIDGESW
jgi:glycosyltransferase involved in cell wall biosynthesis